MEEPLIRGNAIHVRYGSDGGFFSRLDREVKAVDGASISVRRGETVSVVGESGSGKSTLGRILLGAERPTSGSVHFAGEDITRVGRHRWRQLRGSMQMVFQNAGASFNPRLTIGAHLSEARKLQSGLGQARELPSIATVLDQVGLPRRMLDNYASQLSGGQQQRAAIARALLGRPDFIVCDEIVSALDLSVQAQILNLLVDIQKELKVSLLFISHDLAVVRYLSDQVAVMYFGRIVETGETERVLIAPRHPYTAALLSAVPSLGLDRPRPRRVSVDNPAIDGDFKGCRFYARCPLASARCRVEAPVLSGEPRHLVACHHPLTANSIHA